MSVWVFPRGGKGDDQVSNLYIINHLYFLFASISSPGSMVPNSLKLSVLL